MRPSPRCEMRAQRPHGQREPRKPESFVSQLEELGVTEGRVVLLFVDPVFRKQPLDESLRVALSYHSNRAEGGVKSRDFARADHQRERSEDGPARMGHR